MARKLAIIALVALTAALSQLVGQSSAAPELALSPSLATRAGDLDPSFDGDGKVVTDFGGLEEAHGVVVQADGKIVVVGPTYDPVTHVEDFALAHGEKRRDQRANPARFGNSSLGILVALGQKPNEFRVGSE